MGPKLMWGGLTMILAVSQFIKEPFVMQAGALIMIIGFVLYVLDK